LRRPRLLLNRVYSVHRIINNPAQEKYYLKVFESVIPFKRHLKTKRH